MTTPTPAHIPLIRLYQNWLREQRGLSFGSYRALWEWSDAPRVPSHVHAYRARQQARIARAHIPRPWPDVNSGSLSDWLVR